MRPMYKPFVRNKIVIYFILTVAATLFCFSLYMLYTFKAYGDKALVSLLFFHARQSENILYNRWYDTNDTDRLSSLVYSMGSVVYEIKTEVINKDGWVIAASRAKITDKNQLEYPEVRDALKGMNASAVRRDESFEFSKSPADSAFFVAIPLRTNPPNQFIIRISASDDLFDKGLHELLFSMFTAFSFITIVCIFLSFIISKKLLAPLEEITQVAKELSKGNLNEKIRYSGENEFGILANTLNNLSASLSTTIKELYGEKQKQEMILEQMDNIVILVDRSGSITSINHRGRYVFHSNRNTCSIGMHNLEVIGSPLLDNTIKECFENDASKIIDLQLTRNGVKYVFQVFASTLTSINEQQPAIVLLVFHDITALLSIYEKQIDFIANASHELATPLTSIKGFSETLLDGALQSPELSQKFVKIIYEESEHMQKLVKDLLQLTRLDSSEYRQAITFSAFSSEGLWENIKERLAQQIEMKALVVEIDYKDEPRMIYANQDWFKQALINLMENAIKYSPDNGKIKLTYEHDEEFAIFSIQDQGPGIAQENIPFIFDRFYRADKSRAKSKVNGTGIGLAIVKFIVELFGGQILVDSHINIGSTFTVTVPLAKEEHLLEND